MTEPRHEARHWLRIKQALERGVNVEIVAMHADVRPARLATCDDPADALNLWAHYMNAPAFFEHVEDCWKALLLWEERATAAGLNGLRVIGTYFPPLTMTAVDPDDSTGLVVFVTATTS